MSSAVTSTKAVAAKEVKQKKKKTAAPPAHPSFKQMILEAIRHLKDDNGSSRKMIRKVIEEKHAPKTIGSYLNKNLARMTKSGELTHPKKHPGKYAITTEMKKKKPKTSKKSPKKPKVVKKEVRQKKTKAAEKKKKTTVKMAKKKSPVKKLSPKKVKGPPSPKKSPGQKKGGRGRQKKK